MGGRLLPLRWEHSPGFTLTELLVATAIAALVLAGAFGWLWTLAGLATRVDDGVQAATIASACSREIARDVLAAMAFQPPEGRDPARSISVVHDHVGSAVDNVVIVWDPSRRVVWRNAPGTYLADHVAGFGLEYLLEDGRLVDGGGMSSLDWSAVRGVRVHLTTSVGSATADRTILVAVGAT